MTALLHFWTSHSTEFAARLGQHIVLVAVSTCVSAAIGVPLGIFSAHRPRVGAPLVAAANTRYGSSQVPNLEKIQAVAARLFSAPGTAPIPWPTPKATKPPKATPTPAS